MQNKVQIVPDDLGNAIRVSSNNPEFGHVRLVQKRVTFGNSGWVKPANLSTLIHGKVEDLKELGLATATTLTGKIVIKEQTTPFNQENPDRDLKIAGDTGIICCSYGEPIYRKTFFTADLAAEDVLVSHTNGEDIKQANGTYSPQAEAPKQFAVNPSDAFSDLISDDEEETEEEIIDELEESFDL